VSAAGVVGCQGGAPGYGMGLSSQAAIDGFAADMAALQQDWPQLAGADRLARMQGVVDQLAAAHGFAAPDVTSPRGMGNDSGLFDFSVWEVQVARNLVDVPTLDAASAAKLGDTLYHETRHCEQWFAMARGMAGAGASDVDIEQRMGIPAAVAMQAAGSPILRGSAEHAFAAQMYTSVYGTGAAQRGATLGNLDTLADGCRQAAQDVKAATAAQQAAYNAALADHQLVQGLQGGTIPGTAADLQRAQASFTQTRTAYNAATQEVQAAQAQLGTARQAYAAGHAAYQALPEEADAWDCGGRAGTAIAAALGGTP